MDVWSLFLSGFQEFSVGHIALAIYLYVIMDERGCRMLKKLPVLVFSPALASLIHLSLYNVFKVSGLVLYVVISVANVLMCTLWVRWGWRIGIGRALAAVCMAGVFQMAASVLSARLFSLPAADEDLQFMMVTGIYFTVVLGTAVLLKRKRFGSWFQLLLEEDDPHRIALLLSAMLVSMEVFFQLRVGIGSEYQLFYYMLVLVFAALLAVSVIHLAQRLDAIRKIETQREVIARQQLYEQELEAIRREARAFRHDYKNILAGLSAQAGAGELDALLTSLADLDAGFDQRVGEKIRMSTQIGNLRIPQVRGILLSKMAAMGEKGVDCRLEAIYPVERLGMDSWDFVRCLGILLDNAAEAALETKTPWVEVIVLAERNRLSLRVSNPYVGTIDPDKIWLEGYSTKGEGRGLGLPGYQRILADCPGVSCSTSWAAGIFVQELTVEDKL